MIETDIIAVLEGNLRGILTGERIALNFLQKLSGITSMTKAFVQMIDQESNTSIVDTRKTTPGWRLLEKYAVSVGGGVNHRFGLDDGILIKDNHIKAAGSVSKAIETMREKAHHLLKIEVETSNLDQVKEAVNSKADIIMLDNMSDEQISEAIQLINKKALVEVSGNIDVERVKELSKMDVDFISVGAITHSAVAKDINMTLEI